MKRSATQVVKRGGGEYAKVQLRKNETINTLFSLLCGRLHQDKKEGGDFRFSSTKIERKTPNFVGLYKL